MKNKHQKGDGSKQGGMYGIQNKIYKGSQRKIKQHKSTIMKKMESLIMKRQERKEKQRN